MRKVLGRVLVIDDDPLMLRVLRELLEGAGYDVHARESASGIAQVIVQERIDAAVIDWDLPDMQGDAVIRLLRTWEDVKDLPVLLITGAEEETRERIRSQLPGVRIVTKENLRDELISALGTVLGTNKTVRGLPPVVLGKGGEFTVGKQRNKASDLVPQLLTQLAETLPLARTVWTQASQGRTAQVESVVQSLDLLAGQARLLALDEAASLLQALTETLNALPEDRKVPRDVKRAIDGGIEALSSLSNGVDGAFTIPPEPVIGALHRARSSFPPRPERQG